MLTYTILLAVELQKLEKWSYIYVKYMYLKTEPIGFSDEIDVGRERMEEGKDDSKIWASATVRRELPTTNMEKTVTGGVSLRGKSGTHF